MNEVLIRRLIGALTLLLVALGIGFLLPSPEPPRPEDGLKRVTIDLQSAEIVETLPAEPDTALPPVIAAPEALPESAVLVEAAGDAEPMETPAAAPKTAAPKDAPAGPPAAPPAVASIEAPAVRSQPKAPPVQLKATETLKLAPPAATVAAPKPAPAVGATPPPVAAAPAAATRAPEKPAAVAARPAVTPEPSKSAPAPGGRWFVQVGSFSDISNARDAEGKLRSVGLPTVLSPIETSKGTLYRVRIAPLPGEAQAAVARGKAQQLGFAQAIAKQE